MSITFGPCGPPVIQDGTSRGYLFAVFKLVAHEESEIRTIYHIALSREGYCSCKVSRVCVASVQIEIWALKMEGMIELSMINRSSDANMSFKHYNPLSRGSRG